MAMPTPEAGRLVVALGGDGHMLQTLHRFVSTGIPIYGMNRGSVGFLMNDYDEDSLLERLTAAELTIIHPLRMTAIDAPARPTAASPSMKSPFCASATRRPSCAFSSTARPAWRN